MSSWYGGVPFGSSINSFSLSLECGFEAAMDIGSV